MKRYRGWTLPEMYDMTPADIETFYYMAVMDYKIEKGIK